VNDGFMDAPISGISSRIVVKADRVESPRSRLLNPPLDIVSATATVAAALVVVGLVHDVMDSDTGSGGGGAPPLRVTPKALGFSVSFFITKCSNVGKFDETRLVCDLFIN
jgi:hypothetical protein